MPKLIDHLRQDLLLCAADILQTEGYNALTLRRVAENCHIAVGTIYNYFPSKDDLAAQAMLADWRETVKTMERRCSEAQTVRQGLLAVYEGIEDFAQLYTHVWSEYAPRSGVLEFLRQKHSTTLAQLSTVVDGLLRRFDSDFDPYLPTFVAQSLLSAVTREQVPFATLAPLLCRLCQ